MRALFNKSIEFWGRWERHLSAIALAAGFIFDLIIADRPDSIPNNILLLSYLIIAGTLIIILNIKQMRRRLEEHLAQPIFLLLLLQFCFGGLASNLLILYGRSGTLAGSALFLAILGGMLIGNEFLKTRYAQLSFNIGVYYLLLLTYFIIAVPVFLTHTIGTWVFLLSGLISLLFIGAFLALLFYTVLRGRDIASLFGVSRIVAGIFLLFNVLYFVNVIPPVPLSLEEIGIYHSILKRQDGSYLALYEKAPWWQFWNEVSGTYTLGAGGSAFCFSSIFAPTDLTTPAYHKWERYSDTGGEWRAEARIAFPISGGRADGYRGFSTKSRLEQGRWRCNVETAQGALIGRITFTVVAGPAPELSQKTL